MRTLSATITSAVAQDVTQPIYLLRMGFSSELTVATWGADINWNGETWSASGIAVKRLGIKSGSIEFPLADDGPWLSLLLNEGARERAITIYEYHTDLSASPQVSDAVAVFTGIMDGVRITDRAIVEVLESTTAKRFPHTSIDRPVYNYLPVSGSRITWGTDYLVVE